MGGESSKMPEDVKAEQCAPEIDKNSKFHFKVYNYTSNSNCLASKSFTLEAWKSLIKLRACEKKIDADDQNQTTWLEDWEEIKDDQMIEKTIISWSRCMNPLSGMEKSAPKKGGTSNRLYHDFFVYELCDKRGNLSAASLERGKPDIIFQYCEGEKDNLAKVRDFRLGVRRNTAHSWKEDRFGTIVTAGLHTLVQDMNQDSLNKEYDLLRRNCQIFANELRGNLKEKSLELELKIPGTDKTTTLKNIDKNSKTIQFIEKNFPKWEKDELEIIPKDHDFREFQKEVKMGEIELPKETIYKESVSDAIKAYLKRQKGRKALMLNASKQSFRETLINSRLSKNGKNEGGAECIDIEIMSEKWKSALDMVVIAEAIGIAIVTFRYGQDDDSEKAYSQIDEAKLEMAAAILPSNSKAVIHSIQINLGANDSKVFAARKSNKYRIDICVQPDVDSQKSIIPKLVNEVFGMMHNDIKLENQRVFLTRLYILQYMMNMGKVMHETLENQEWGQKGICIWTKEQKNIIDEIMLDIKQGDDLSKIRKVISGGPGSGKTLMLQEIAKQALNVKVEENGRLRQRNVFIGIPSCNTKLRAMLKSKFKGKDGCRIGNEFSKRAYGKDGWADLIIWDEKGLEIGEEIKAFEKLEKSRKSVIVFSLYSHSLKDFKTSQLNNGNLRCSRKISDFIGELERAARPSLDLRHLSQIQNISQIQIGDEEPRIVAVDDGSNDRMTFLSKCKMEILDIESKWNEGKKSNKTEIMVCPIISSEFRKRLQSLLKSSNCISFGDPAEITGCQYPCVILIIDINSCFASEYHIQQAMTRATTSLTCIVNTSDIAPRINGHSPFEICESFDVLSQKASANENIFLFRGNCGEKNIPGATIVNEPIFDKETCITHEEKNSSLNICGVNEEFPNNNYRRLQLFAPTVWICTTRNGAEESREQQKRALDARRNENENIIKFFNQRHQSKTQSSLASSQAGMAQLAGKIFIDTGRNDDIEEKIVEANSKFDCGFDYIVAFFCDSILVWGGYEVKESSNGIRPTNVIDKYSLSTKTWSKIEAQGDIHPASFRASCVVIKNTDNELAYIFGGKNSEGKNQLSTLSPKGKFTRVDVVGKQVLPRRESCSWSFNGNPYFAFGLSDKESYQDSVFDGEDYLAMDPKQWDLSKGGLYRTNEILEFNTRERIFTRFETKGISPLKTEVNVSHHTYGSHSAAVAAIGEKVFVLGDEKTFFQLDMSSRQWTRFKDYHLGLIAPSLSVISKNELMLVNVEESITRIYNVEDNLWTDGPPLPPVTDERTGKLVDAGLFLHKAVEVKEGNRVAKIICLGGQRRWKLGKGEDTGQNSNMLEIDVDQKR